MLVVDESSFSSKLTILYLKLVIGYFATHPEIGSKLTILYLKPLYL